MSHVEINEQTDSYSTQPHIRQKLRVINGMNRLNAFNLDDDEVLDHQVHPVPQFDLLSVVNHRQTDLADHLEPTLPQFMSQTTLIALSSSPGPSTA
jgi:hypothetical protein